MAVWPRGAQPPAVTGTGKTRELAEVGPERKPEKGNMSGGAQGPVGKAGVGEGG